MIKAAIISLGVPFLLATAPVLQAQESAKETAVNQAVYREANRVTLRQKLLNAGAATQRGDLVGAAKLYDDCWELVQKIGSGVDAEARDTKAGLAATRLELAHAAMRRSDNREARTQIDDVLRVDPSNREALDLKRENDKLIRETMGKVPSEEVVAKGPAIVAEKTKASTLVQDGKFLYEMQKLDQAEAKLKEAVKIDPQNQAAYYYLNIIREARYTQALNKRDVESRQKLVEIEEAWENPPKRELLPVPNPYNRTNLTHIGKGRQEIYLKLDRIRLDTVKYDGLPLGEVIVNLNDEARKRDPEKRGINFIINPNADATIQTMGALGGMGGMGGAGGAGGLNPYGAAPQMQAAQIDPTTGLPLAAAAPAEPVDINAISIKINPPLTDMRLADVLEVIVKVAEKPIRFSVEEYGVVFSLRGQEVAPLHTRIIKVDPNTFVQGLENVVGVSFGDISTSSGGGGGGNTGGGGGFGGGGGGGGYGGGGGGFGGGGGSMTMVPRVMVAGGGYGGGMGGGGYGGGMGGGGYGGGGMMGGGMMGGGMGGGGYGGGGMMGGGMMGGGMGGMMGGGGVMAVSTRVSMDMVQSMARYYFMSMGVDLTPPKNLFFNDREGTLIVRATTEDLDIIQAAVQVLNIAPPQINIKAKFVEVSQNDNRALGFDWYLGNVLMNNGSLALSGGTAPSYAGAPSTANPSGYFPGTSPSTVQPPSASDQLVTSGLRNVINAPAIGTFSGILTDPQFRVVIRALEQREGVDLLNEASVTTLSGRQTQIQVVDLVTIVTGTSLNQTTGGGGAGTVAGGTTAPGAIGSTVNYPTAVQPFGPTLDVIPYVSADGFTIQMTIIPTVTEFLGYDDPGQFIPQAQSVSGQGGVGIPIRAQLPLPHFRLRQVTTSAIVWDGQTVVLGGLITEDVTKLKDKVPVLGDLPVVGRLFRSEGSSTKKKNLMIFVTPTILDPAGNPSHTEDEMPFAQTQIPARPTAPVVK